jgi:hypothetical protein
MPPSASVNRRPLSLIQLAEMYETIGARVTESCHRASRMAALAQCEVAAILSSAAELDYPIDEKDPKFSSSQAAAIIRKLSDAQKAR